MANFQIDASHATQTVDGLYLKEFIAENDVNGNPVYVGYAKPGESVANPVWQIKKYTYDGNQAATNAEWANDNTSFKFVWNDRATYFV